MKNTIRKIAQSFGYEIRRIDPFPAGSESRPVGNMLKFLEDMQARGLKCKNILDVGAHVGSWSKEAMNVYPKANYCLIEPQVELEPHLSNFCKTANDSIYFIAGAGAANGKQYLTMPGSFSASSFLGEPNNELIANGTQRELDIITIDSIIESGNLEFPNW